MKAKRCPRVAIIGGGPAGLACAHSLMDVCEVTLYERGKSIGDRLKDPNPDITSGLGGAGAFSDGKVTLSPFVGTNQYLLDLYGDRFIANELQRVDKFFLDHGASEGQIKTAEYPEDFKRQCRIAQFDLIDRAAVRHIGTTSGGVVIQNIVSEMQNKVEIISECEVVPNLKFRGDKIALSSSALTDEKEYDYVVLAVGRSGADWLRQLYEATELPYLPGVVDIGVRLETKAEVFDDFYKKYSYEPKLSRLSSFGERTRSFCACLNGYGHVAQESYAWLPDENGNPLKLANGHSYSEGDTEHYSGNANLAILVSCQLTSPFKDAIGYARSIGRLVNVLADQNLLLQSYKDFKKQRRSTDKRIKESGITPSLQEGWMPGDVSLAIPHRIMKAIEEFVDNLAIIFPGVDSSLLYALEAKMYSNMAQVAEKKLHYEGYPNCYIAGDSSGLCRALSTSAMMGFLVADQIKMKLEG